MKNKGYAKFWGANEVHYGRCASGEYGVKPKQSKTFVAKKMPDTLEFFAG